MSLSKFGGFSPYPRLLLSATLVHLVLTLHFSGKVFQVFVGANKYITLIITKYPVSITAAIINIMAINSI